MALRQASSKSSLKPRVADTSAERQDGAMDVGDGVGDALAAGAEEAVESARRLLADLGLDSADAFLERARAALADLERAVELVEAGRTRRPRGQGARQRILSYFLSRGIGTPISARELRQISGIQEWARRIRELRVERGWDIRYDGTAYRLMSDSPDTAVAEAWRLANSIRRKSLSARERILEYLKARVGDVVDSELLHYVSGIQEHGRRIRELRTEFGYPISSYIDRPELAPGEYVLESVNPTLDVTERNVSEALRKKVFERDQYRCVLCEREAGSGVLLTAHHLVAKLEGGSDTDPANFVTLCHKDHASITGEQQQELLRKRRRGSS